MERDARPIVRSRPRLHHALAAAPRVGGRCRRWRPGPQHRQRPAFFAYLSDPLLIPGPLAHGCALGRDSSMMGFVRKRKILARTIVPLLVIAVVAAWGTGRAMLSKPSTVDRYIVIDGDTFVLLPKSCVYTIVKLGCPAQR